MCVNLFSDNYDSEQCCAASAADHCGLCETSCQACNVCSGGQCALTCQQGLTNCSGTCVNLQTDLGNCGQCGAGCAAGQVCSGGKCALSCQAGLSVCNGTCVN